MAEIVYCQFEEEGDKKTCKVCGYSLITKSKHVIRVCGNARVHTIIRFVPKTRPKEGLKPPSDQPEEARKCKGCEKKDHGGYLQSAVGDYEPLPGIKLPNRWALARNFLKAAAKRAKDPRNVSPEEYVARLTICENCPSKLRLLGRCTHKDCGCVLAKKARWATEGCPVGHWLPVAAVTLPPHPSASEQSAPGEAAPE